MRMKKNLIRALQILGLIVIILTVTYSGFSVIIYGSSGRFPVKRTQFPPVRVRNLIWPTIGYPALVAPGSSLEAEFDFNEIGPGARAQEDRPSAWNAVLNPSRQALKGLSYKLKAVRAWKAVSSRWPGGTSRGGPYQVWHAEFKIPAGAVPELYDLTVEAQAPGRKLSDSQKHAVSISEKISDDLRFITLADIHVHRRNITGIAQKQTNKGISPEGKPIFFENAIDQVNLIKPDFVVLLGDFVRAQHAPGDYQVEFANFFNALSRFQVPVFTVPGNHDQYVNEVDGSDIWEESFGPLYYSFDVARCHFTVANSYEWPNSDRIVMEKLGFLVYPRKWQGQLKAAPNEKDINSYAGQLGWLRDDLAAHVGSKLRVLLIHHDPYSPGGEGDSWKNERFFGVYTLGGGGTGAKALGRLVSTYHVNAVFSGHLHFDNMGQLDWQGGTPGTTLYANQTMVYFDEGGIQKKYPGYRLVQVTDGKMGRLSYADDKSSIPFYDGSVPNGETNLDLLSRPALSALTLAAAGRAAGAARAVPGTGVSTLNGWLVKNYLRIPMDLKGLVFEAADSITTYSVSGGQVYRTVKIPGSNRVLLYVRVNVGRGIPGASAATPGIPRQVQVLVKSQASAKTATQKATVPQR